MYLRLKKHHPTDYNENTLEEQRVEKDLRETPDTTLKLQDAGKGESKIQSDSNKKPEHNSEGYSNRPA